MMFTNMRAMQLPRIAILTVAYQTEMYSLLSEVEEAAIQAGSTRPLLLLDAPGPSLAQPLCLQLLEHHSWMPVGSGCRAPSREDKDHGNIFKVGVRLEISADWACWRKMVADRGKMLAEGGAR